MRRFLITCVAILVVLFSAMGVESLIMGDHNSILRQTLTSPVKQFIDGSRINSNQVVVAVDAQIDPYMQRTYFKATIDAIDKTVRDADKFLVLKFLDRETISAMLADGEIDFLISESDFYASLAFEDKIKAIAMLWRAQAKSPIYSAASTIVVNAENEKIYTLTDIATGSYRVAATSSDSFAGFTIAKEPFAEKNLSWQAAFKNIVFTSNRNPLEVLNAVKTGNADVGIVPACFIEQVMIRNQAHLSDYRVINPQPVTEMACQHSTNAYPSLMVSYRNGVDSNYILDMTNALLGLKLPFGTTWSMPENTRELYDLMYHLRIGPYNNVTYSAIYRTFSENRTIFITAIFLIVAGFFYNLIISVEVASRTKALKRALAEKDRISKQQEQTNEYISRLERTGIVGQMSSMIAHELKQPLATVSNYSRGLLRRIERGSADKDTIVKVLKEIEYHTERANDIVDHVRSYAKPHEVKREEHDLRDIVAKTVATFEKSGRTTVPVIVEGERHALVEADDWEIELALLNLLKNSADAFTEIHPAMRDEDEDVIRIRIEDHKDTWWIRVIDNAKLVDESFTEQFFQKLETTKAHGLGLGLSIVSSLAERHAGRVWAEPNPGRGVIVTIELPKYQPIEEKI
ncbi:PhnD/SsuA/transferrin family substrate-binding protein [Parasutterella secunda]|uniref:sensor histidine kinase n=1 Tax=Parasutterella secunda TaxID=626947 RepID=UPI0025A3A7BA|nr:sensor histidine kinase [Parasutterella secunda]MDM8086852.1 PhnD/SsuA/transferrin family substrate-binding protein [Parasutterella secunda]